MKFVRNFELVGIPIHLSTQAYFRKLTSTIGIVRNIHFKKHSFVAVEVEVTMETNNPKHTNPGLLFITDSHRSYKFFVKEIVPCKNEDEELIITMSPSGDKERQNHEEGVCGTIVEKNTNEGRR